MYFLKQTLKRKAAYWVIAVFLFAFGLIMSHEYSVNEIDFKAVSPYVYIDDYSDSLRVYDLLEEKDLSPVLCIVEDDMDDMEERITVIGTDTAVDKLFRVMQLSYGLQTRLLGLSKSLYRVRKEELTDSCFTEEINEIICVLMADTSEVMDVSAEWLWENGIGNIYIPKKTIRMKLFPKLCAVWLVICLICVFLICFSAEINRKAIYTWMLNGTGYVYIIFLEVVTNAVYYVLLCAAMAFFVSHTGIILWPAYSPMLICAGLLCADMLCCLLIFKSNIRKVFGADSGDQKILVFAFLLKGITVVFILLAISLNSKSISDFYVLSRNYAFYDLHRDHYMLPEPADEDWDDYYSFYKEEIDNGNAELYMYLYSTQNKSPVYKINGNSLTWLRKLYPSLAGVDTKKNMIIAPASCDKADIEKLEKLISSVSSEDIDIYYYEEKVYLPMIGAGEDETGSSKDNIFVLYEYIPSGENSYDPDLLWATFRSSSGDFRINEKTTLKGINISTAFFDEYKSKKNMFVLGLLSVAVLAAFEAAVTVYIVNIEYRLNSVLFALRRINGMGLVRTYSFMFVADVITITLGMTVSLIIGSRHIEGFSISVSAIGMLFLIILECIIGGVCTLINEKRSIVKVFKTGGI